MINLKELAFSGDLACRIWLMYGDVEVEFCVDKQLLILKNNIQFINFSMLPRIKKFNKAGDAVFGDQEEMYYRDINNVPKIINEFYTIIDNKKGITNVGKTPYCSESIVYDSGSDLWLDIRSYCMLYTLVKEDDEKHSQQKEEIYMRLAAWSFLFNAALGHYNPQYGRVGERLWDWQSAIEGDDSAKVIHKYENDDEVKNEYRD